MVVLECSCAATVRPVERWPLGFGALIWRGRSPQIHQEEANPQSNKGGIQRLECRLLQCVQAISHLYLVSIYELGSWRSITSSACWQQGTVGRGALDVNCRCAAAGKSCGLTVGTICAFARHSVQSQLLFFFHTAAITVFGTRNRAAPLQMQVSQIRFFQQSCVNQLRRPWQTFKDGQLWYGITKTGSKRHPLTTKQGNKHYYKGTRSSGVGLQDSHGRYIVNWNKVRTYVVPPNLETSELKSLVSPRVPQIHQKFIGYPDGAKNAQLAFKNIIDFIEHGENYNDVNLEESQYLEEFVNEEIAQNESTRISVEAPTKESST